MPRLLLYSSYLAAAILHETPVPSIKAIKLIKKQGGVTFVKAAIFS